MTHRVYFTNHRYFAQEEFSTLADALAAAKRACFEATIYGDEELQAFWSPIGGLRLYRGAR